MLNVLIVVVALKLLDTGNAGVGFLNSAVGVGGLLGALAAAALVGRGRLAADFGVGIFIWGVPIALLAVWPNQIFALVLLGIVGIGNTIVDVSGMTLLQRAAPDEVIARVFGVMESLFLLTVGLGALAAPLLLNWLGTRGALIAAGALLPLLVVPAWPRLNDMDRAARVPLERLAILQANSIFSPLPEPTLEQLAEGLEEVDAPPGKEVVRQGEPGDRFYLVKDGALEVYIDGKLVQTLGPGTRSARSPSCATCPALRPCGERPPPPSTRSIGAPFSPPSPVSDRACPLRRRSSGCGSGPLRPGSFALRLLVAEG